MKNLTVNETFFDVNIALKTVLKFVNFVYNVLLDIVIKVCYTIIKEQAARATSRPTLERWLSYGKGIRLL